MIVGAGFGGLELAKGLSSADAEITVVDRNNYHLFQPLLYQVATAGLAAPDIAYPIRSVLRGSKNTSVLMAEVTGLDTRKQQVLTSKGQLSYDYLVLATGSQYNYFGHDEWEPVAPNLKSIPSALEIRERILKAFEDAEAEPNETRRKQLMTIVLVGAGPTGVELAGAIAELTRRALAQDFRRIDPASARVVLVDAGPRVLASFPESLSRKARVRLEHMGVEVRTDAKVNRVDSEGVQIGEEMIPSSTIVWTAGVKASPAAQWLGVETDRSGRVPVKPDLTVEGHPNVFVIGDTAAALGDDGKPFPGLAPVAMQQGRYVAKILRQRLDGARAGEVEPFRYVDKGNLATIGRSAGVADFKGIRLFGFGAWLLWLGVHLFYLIGFRNRAAVMLQWAWSYLTFQRGARVIPNPESKLEREPLLGGKYGRTAA